MFKIVRRMFPEFLRLCFFVLISPFYNLWLSLRYGCLIHPLARISPRVRLARGCVVGCARLRTYHDGRIFIGDHTVIHEDCELYAHRGTTVSVGSNCLLAKRTVVMTRNHVFADPERLICEQGTDDRDVKIGSDVWTGLDCKILPGVQIENGCVIGTAAVVTRNLPPLSVAVGIPARVIRTRGACK